MNAKILNSVCFIRKYGWENTEEDFAKRRLSLMKQMEYNNQYDIKATYLLQYDALMDDTYKSILKTQTKSGDEIGLWLEVVQDLTEECDIPWRGREGWPWDYHVNPGFLMAYTAEEKYRLIDAAMVKFYEEFTCYPQTVGSWLIDSESMAYLSEKYHTDAFIICREQWGMDGYTLWGGNYYGGYYPSKNNMQTPAQTLDMQINTPVFRMFINDPLYSYYEFGKEKYNKIDWWVFTQEPVWICGQNPDWMKWMYDALFTESSSGFRYIQLGQENSFDWEGLVEKGFPMQVEFATKNQLLYGYENMTVGEMGRLFKRMNKETPAMSLSVLTDWADLDNQTVWYNNKHYRINIFADKERLWIKDIHVYFDDYRDAYLDKPCKAHTACYDNPPIMDGVRFSDEDVQAGMYFGKGRIISCEQREDCYEMVLETDQRLIVRCYDQEVEIAGEMDFAIAFTVKEPCETIREITENYIAYSHNGLDYRLDILCGSYKEGTIVSEGGKVRWSL